jgi:hypothetical protein
MFREHGDRAAGLRNRGPSRLSDDCVLHGVAEGQDHDEVEGPQLPQLLASADAQDEDQERVDDDKGVRSFR